MTHPAQDANEATCWQCGAPADPASAYTQVLHARPTQGADPLGYPVDKSTVTDVIRVDVPRCASCRLRGLVSWGLPAVGIGLGLLAGVAIHSSGAAVLIGGALGLGLTMLAMSRARLSSGRPSVQDYPPLVQLREGGWREPKD